MRIGELVEWDDPGKDEVGIVSFKSPPNFNATTRIEVTWFSDYGVRISHPKLMEIKLVEPRKTRE